MSQSTTTSAAFLSLTALMVVGAAAGLALGWPLMQAAVKTQAAQLIGEGTMANPAEAMADYRLAVWLDPSNVAGELGLATMQIRAGQPEAALLTLKSTGAQSEARNLRVRTLIELGRVSEAAELAPMLADPGRAEEDIILTAFAYALAGRPADVAALAPLLSSPEGAQRLARVQAGTLPLAAELYAAGLPNSSSALLQQQPVSFTRNRLLAHIAVDHHTAADLARASDYLAIAVAGNPSNIEAHRQYAQVLADRGLSEESGQQMKLADRLQAGRP